LKRFRSLIREKRAALNNSQRIEEGNPLTGQEQYPQNETLKNDENPALAPVRRKKFVEPEISQPIDVLEATTFFQAIDSGATGKPQRDGG
jgi:hypothetical protein